MRILLILFSIALFGCSQDGRYDLILRNGMIYDGSGTTPYVGDLAINADTIAAVGDLKDAQGKEEIDLNRLAVAPGFINMLSWATESLIVDGRSQSDIRQGVTLEVMGEGNSMGPLTEEMRKDMIEEQGDIRFDIEWTTLGEYLEYLVEKGVSTNVASFIGNATVRKNILGYDSRPPTEEELEQMRQVVRQAMEEGAVGISSALIYVPSMHSSTSELIELAKVVAEYDGMYISHLRSEGRTLLEALDELITIAREAEVRSEIYHLKASEESNWHKLDSAFSMIEAARSEGLEITADMYMYPASSTGLTQVLPEWVLEGGIDSTIERFKRPELRDQIIADMFFPCDAEGILMVGFRNDSLKKHTGKSLALLAEERNQSPEETVIDIIVEDDSRISCVFFSMSEENVKKKIAQPWMSFCSDAGSLAPEGVFLKSNPHPRAYGSFARLLGKYVREEKIIPLEEAIRRLTSFPAENLKIKKRGRLEGGYFADVVVFDPNTIQDHATFEQPHQYATGVRDVWVNGIRVLKNGEHTGAPAGRVVRGPGWNQPE
jgi:N-acyl-D-amino-acid deacylase